jgi:selenium metabolism protein YedF
VDNQSAVTNVAHMAKSAGWQVAVTEQGSEYRIELSRNGTTGQPGPLGVSGAEIAGGPLVLVLGDDRMGRGEPELGSILMRGFFQVLGEAKPVPDTIILVNSGARLAGPDSPVLDDLRRLEQLGVDIVACSTCLSYFHLLESCGVGRISGMFEIAETMLKAGKVLTF